MTDYTRSVLDRAQELRRLEHAAIALSTSPRHDLRGWIAAGIAALMSLIPSISAAQMLIP
ncbi:MAG: hypothetical protein IKK21_11460 [Clostridia bacterium]|nr:hypothetical protein [Clostridia bacterium]